MTCVLTRQPIALAAGATHTRFVPDFHRPEAARPAGPVSWPATIRTTRSRTSSTTAGRSLRPWPGRCCAILHFFYGIVGNYGIAIIMLTVLVRGLLFPISYKQTQNMARMQALKPEMDRINEKYKTDMQKQSQAMQELYRKHKINPLGGCLPLFLQLPIFIGLYRSLTVDVELRQSPLFGDGDSLVLEPGRAGHALELVGDHARLHQPGPGHFRPGTVPEYSAARHGRVCSW